MFKKKRIVLISFLISCIVAVGESGIKFADLDQFRSGVLGHLEQASEAPIKLDTFLAENPKWCAQFVSHVREKMKLFFDTLQQAKLQKNIDDLLDKAEVLRENLRDLRTIKGPNGINMSEGDIEVIIEYLKSEHDNYCSIESAPQEYVADVARSLNSIAHWADMFESYIQGDTQTRGSLDIGQPIVTLSKVRSNNVADPKSIEDWTLKIINRKPSKSPFVPPLDCDILKVAPIMDLMGDNALSLFISLPYELAEAVCKAFGTNPQFLRDANDSISSYDKGPAPLKNIYRARTQEEMNDQRSQNERSISDAEKEFKRDSEMVKAKWDSEISELEKQVNLEKDREQQKLLNRQIGEYEAQKRQEIADLKTKRDEKIKMINSDAPQEELNPIVLIMRCYSLLGLNNQDGLSYNKLLKAASMVLQIITSQVLLKYESDISFGEFNELIDESIQSLQRKLLGETDATSVDEWVKSLKTKLLEKTDEEITALLEKTDEARNILGSLIGFGKLADKLAHVIKTQLPGKASKEITGIRNVLKLVIQELHALADLVDRGTLIHKNGPNFLWAVLKNPDFFFKSDLEKLNIREVTAMDLIPQKHILTDTPQELILRPELASTMRETAKTLEEKLLSKMTEPLYGMQKVIESKYCPFLTEAQTHAEE